MDKADLEKAGRRKIGVVVASLGRPEELAQLLNRLAAQTIAPSAVVLSVETLADLPAEMPPTTRVVMGARGSSAQRNRGIALIEAECEIIVFFDDDYLPSDWALSGVIDVFSAHPDVVGATGHLLADGINSGGIPYDEARRILKDFDVRPQKAERHSLVDLRGVYGCNMAFRVSALSNVRFDEELPLYGWQEDVDFAARLLRFGRIVKTDAFSGVHRGVTRGRTSGLRFGFSQVVNPIYLVRKGSMTLNHAARLIMKNVLANHIRALRPEPWVDRIGRVRGNWLGIIHLLSGKANPGRILDLH